MTTFIWTNEYSLFIINKETVEEAIEELKKITKREIESGKLDDYEVEQLQYQPNYIVEDGGALFIEHTNE